MATEKELCEPVCKKQACAIQFCLQRHDYQESKCTAIIKRYYDCCVAATEAEEKTTKSSRQKPTGTLSVLGMMMAKRSKSINSSHDLDF